MDFLRIRGHHLPVDGGEIPTLLDENLEDAQLVVVVQTEQHVAGYRYVAVVLAAGVAVTAGDALTRGLRNSDGSAEQLPLSSIELNTTFRF